MMLPAIACLVHLKRQAAMCSMYLFCNPDTRIVDDWGSRVE
jgi:hypothetical protein